MAAGRCGNCRRDVDRLIGGLCPRCDMYRRRHGGELPPAGRISRTVGDAVPLRFSDEQRAAMDRLRGEIPLAEWVREAVAQRIRRDSRRRRD